MSALATLAVHDSANAALRPRLAEGDVLTVHPDDPLTVDRLLRRLELLRKRLSVRWCGVEGAFAGYDRLDVDELSGIRDGMVVLEAHLIDTGEASHVVELIASRPASNSTATSQVLVRGIGRALQTRSSANA